jgi:hypothetical protein
MTPLLCATIITWSIKYHPWDWGSTSCSDAEPDGLCFWDSNTAIYSDGSGELLGYEFRCGGFGTYMAQKAITAWVKPTLAQSNTLGQNP